VENDKNQYQSTMVGRAGVGHVNDVLSFCQPMSGAVAADAGRDMGRSMAGRFATAEREVGGDGEACREDQSKVAVMEGPMVVVVDDDESVRESLPPLLAQLGYVSNGFASAEDFLASEDLDKVDSLILDVTMPGMSGPDLQRELRRRGYDMPIIFITAQREEGLRAHLLGMGVVAVLFKPFSDAALEEALDAAFRGK
jgi:CheY-like chemotaxis protein